MKNKRLNLILVFSIFFSIEIFSQGAPWTLPGNGNATAASFLGTTNAVPLNLKTTLNQPMNFFTNNVQRATLFGNNPPAPPVWYSPLPFGGGMGINLNTTNPILHPMALLHIGEYPSTL